MGRAGLWPMPPLRGILTCPTLRPDGSPLLTPGYDPQSQYYFAHRLNVKISSQPTRSEATDRIEFVKDLLSGFSFVEPVDRTVALALILSTMVRPILDHMPLFAITAPVRGSGKSYLMDIAAIIATGRRTAVLAATTDRAELEKRLTGSLLSGDPCASRDAIMDDDPELAQLRTLLPLWWQEFGKSTIKIKQLIERSHSNDTGLYEVLDDIVGEGKGPGINARSLGHWLKPKKGNVVCGLKLLQVPGKNMASWQVVQVKAGEA